MFELIFVGGIIAGGLLLAVGLLKLLVALLLLPFKLAFLLVKGLFGLFIAIPALVLTSLVVVGSLPVIFIVLLLPVLIIGAVFVGLVRVLFC